MASRLKLQTLLEQILGSRNVYFQPPASLRLSYPCIVYKLNKLDVKRANNGAYLMKNGYTVTVIYKDPDADYKSKLLNAIANCGFNTSFESDNLHHDVFEIFY